ncbi:prepilin-type N-terminal cleavage/methylation domain-containing protein [Piscinibacter defluvii]|uniref:prepilin-type N-terminal cleavage/methylation domain-containing protein n=1 Tax=Piscinibacter defluvii TaxID=1796922 RepID=UPI000FDD3A4C|nr:prepilin-type N-terminal cleavage/methylation domain-containing protein [Piscinibacter defluvii]
MDRPARGLSLVELLVGLAVGMLVVAAAITLLSAQTREQRSAGAELRLMQELRATADLVARDLRRAGHWGDPAPALWAWSASAPMGNPYAALAPLAAASAGASYAYSRDAVENHRLDANEQFGLRLRNGVLELQLGSAGWQALSDPASITVTSFELRPRLQEVSLLGHCPNPCPPGATCDVRLQSRSLAIRLSARAVADPSVQRQLEAEVRLRNPAPIGACPA